MFFFSSYDIFLRMVLTRTFRMKMWFHLIFAVCEVIFGYFLQAKSSAPFKSSVFSLENLFGKMLH